MKSRLSALLVLFATSVIAQSMPQIIPPSPEAAAAFKFTEVPVSLYTGVPNISIPIYEIECGGMKVPISISYHARGIKVGEIASRVGLGWTLNAGGMVSRQVRSYADDLNSQVNFNGILTNENKRLQQWYFVSQNDFPPSGKVDYLPDQYYYNVNGLSGKYINDYTDNSNGVLVQKYSDLQISHNETIYIVDGQGTYYKFGEIGDLGDRDYSDKDKIIPEAGHDLEPPVEDLIFQNTWHLTHMIAKNGSRIKFNYDDETSYFVRRSYDKFNPDIPAQYYSHASKIVSVQKRLKSIHFDKGWVDFEYHSQSREDIEGGNYLKRITIYNNLHQIIKQVEFGYQYVEAAEDNDTHPRYHAWDPHARKRLYLKTVQFKMGSQVALPPYRFEYNAIQLPGRHNNSQDVWGYYNGKANGRMLKSGHETPIGARSVDTIYSAAGMLEKIIYPEGGYTKFYYEHNRVYNPFPSDVVFDNPNPYTTQYVHITSSLDYQNPNIYSATTKKYRKTFTIPETMAGVAKYLVNITDHDGCQYPYNLSTCKFNIKIYNTTTGHLLLQTDPGQTRNIPALKPGTYTLEVEPLYKHHNPMNDSNIGPCNTCPNGYGDPNDPTNEIDFFSVYVRWMQTLPSTEPIYGAGKRIKKIEYHDPVTTQTITKTYDYNDPETGKTSGWLLGLPNFLSIEAQRTLILLGEEFSSYGWIGNIPGSIMSTYQEQSVGYGTVTEYTGEGNNILGKTVHKFTMYPDEGKYFEFPYHPPTDNEWLRGKELAVDYYKKNASSGYTLVKKVQNHYKFGGELIPLPGINFRYPIAVGLEDCPNYEIPFCENADYLRNRKHFRIPFVRFYNAQYTFETENSDIWYKAYHFTGGTIDLSKTTTTDYFDDGSQLQTVDEYFYDYDNHYNVAEHHQTTSIGTEKVITKYYYPGDPEMAGKPAIADLLAMNMREIPLVTQTYKDGTKLSETETVFKDWDIGTGRLVMPEYIKTAKSDNTLENRIQYTKLDTANGNILEVRQVDGNYVSYIWGYDGTYPIAKIENATFQQVLAALNMTEAAVKSLTMIPEDIDIRALLPNALVTTYKYDPLVGPTCITDPNSKNTYYEYDKLKRLKAVRDHDKKLLSETQYNYRPSTP